MKVRVTVTLDKKVVHVSEFLADDKWKDEDAELIGVQAMKEAASQIEQRWADNPVEVTPWPT